MLEAHNLTVGYNGAAVAELPPIALPTGQHCLILGNSGSGKTTLLCTLAGILPPVAGELVLDGTPYSTLRGQAADTFRGRNIGIIFQTLHMVGALSVLDNLLLAQYCAGLPRDRTKAQELLRMLGISDKIHHKTGTLSQGQQQRVAIARAVINEPKVILGDEPTSALDDKACDAVMHLLLHLAAATDASLVIATHDQRIKRYFHAQVTLGDAA